MTRRRRTRKRTRTRRTTFQLLGPRLRLAVKKSNFFFSERVKEIEAQRKLISKPPSLPIPAPIIQEPRLQEPRRPIDRFAFRRQPRRNHQKKHQRNRQKMKKFQWRKAFRKFWQWMQRMERQKRRRQRRRNRQRQKHRRNQNDWDYEDMESYDPEEARLTFEQTFGNLKEY